MRKLLIFLLILVLLVVGADFAGRAIAESKAGEAIGAKAGIAPDVDIHGFSFLAQALPGNYSHITLTAADQRLGPVTGVLTTIDLYDVRLPLKDAIAGDVSSLTAGRAELHATIPAAVIGTAIGIPGLALDLAGDGSTVVTVPVTVAGQTVTAKAALKIGVSGDNLHLVASALPGTPTVPGLGSVLGKLSLDLPLTDLPFTLTGASVTSRAGAVELSAQASNVTVASLR